MTTETLRMARAAYFERSGFDDKTYVDPWVKLPVGRFTLFLPNVPARKEAVRLHDLNHVVTGYGTDWAGELEIAGFELGAGCGRHVMAWVINSGGVAAGLLRQPRKTLRAYARGRASKQSIYRLLPRWDERVLDEPVASMRETLGVPAEATPTARDLIGAASLGLLGIALHFGPVVAIAGGLFAAWRAYA